MSARVQYIHTPPILLSSIPSSCHNSPAYSRLLPMVLLIVLPQRLLKAKGATLPPLLPINFRLLIHTQHPEQSVNKETSSPIKNQRATTDPIQSHSIASFTTFLQTLPHQSFNATAPPTLRRYQGRLLYPSTHVPCYKLAEKVSQGEKIPQKNKLMLSSVRIELTTSGWLQCVHWIIAVAMRPAL